MFSHICKLVNQIFVHTVGQRGERPFRTHKLAHYYCLQEQISSASIKFTFCKIWEFICEYLACSVLKCHKFSFLTESTEQPTCSVDKMPLLDSVLSVQKITRVYFYCCWSKAAFLIWWVLVFAPVARHDRGRLKLCKADSFCKADRTDRRIAQRRSEEEYGSMACRFDRQLTYLWSPTTPL